LHLVGILFPHTTCIFHNPTKNPIPQHFISQHSAGCRSDNSKPCYWIRGLTHTSKHKNKPLTVLTGNRGSDVAEGEEGVGGFSSLLAMACCNCSNLGPRRYLSRHNLTFCPVLLSTSTAWWFV